MPTMKETLDHPDFWGEGVTDEDRAFALSRSDKNFDAKPQADKQLFIKNLASSRARQAQSAAEEARNTAQESQSFLQRTASAVGSVVAPIRDAVTAAVRVPFDLAGKLDVASGIKTPEQAASRAEAYSKFVVPQTATELGMAVGTGGAGKVLGAAGKAIGPLAKVLKGTTNASRAIPAAARVAGTTLGGATGGAVGGAAGNEDESAVAGGLQGLLAGTLGEGAMYGAGKVLRSTPGAAQRIEAKDTKRIGRTIEEINPALRAVRNGADASDINAMAGLGGKTQLSKAYSEGVGNISREVSKVTPTINVPSMNGAVPFNAASQKLRDLNRAAHWDSLSPTDSMIAARDAARTLKKEIGQALETVDAQTGMRGAAKLNGVNGSLEGQWHDVNREFKEGQAIRDFLSRTGHYSGDTEGMRLVTQKLQAALKDPTLAADLAERLGPVNFDKLVKAITRGAERGAQDKVASEAGPLTARGLVSLLTRGGLGSMAGTAAGGPIVGALAGLASAAAFPNAAARYAGKVPYTASGAAKALADMVAGRALPSAGEMSQKAKEAWDATQGDQK